MTKVNLPTYLPTYLFIAYSNMEYFALLSNFRSSGLGKRSVGRVGSGVILIIALVLASMDLDDWMGGPLGGGGLN